MKDDIKLDIFKIHIISNNDYFYSFLNINHINDYNFSYLFIYFLS